MNTKWVAVTKTLLAIAPALLFSQTVTAASCCGGGSASSLILPKFSKAMVDMSIAVEQYDGFWNDQGEHVDDPPGSDLKQYRLNLGYAYRLGSRWQSSVSLPYVWNQNKYAGLSSGTNGLGDGAIGLWYEAFDAIKCVWKVREIKDLAPAIYIGPSLTVPTGVSPYDNVSNSFDITGRGFYRLDANLILDKTIYPWNASLQLAYGTYLERSINREYGSYVEPYRKNLGNRALGSLAFGYTQFLESMDSITYTAAYSDLWEDSGKINGQKDQTTGLRKRAIAGTIAYSSMDRDWVVKTSLSHTIQKSGWGKNFPTTDIISIGVSHVLR